MMLANMNEFERLLFRLFFHDTKDQWQCKWQFCYHNKLLHKMQKYKNQLINFLTKQFQQNEKLKLYTQLLAEKFLTVFCLLTFREIKEFPKKIQKSVVERLLSRHDPKSISTYAWRLLLDVALMCLRYLSRTWHHPYVHSEDQRHIDLILRQCNIS